MVGYLERDEDGWGVSTDVGFYVDYVWMNSIDIM